MEHKNKLKETVERVKSDVQELTTDAKETVNAITGTVREAIPHPVRERIQKRVDTVLLGRRKHLRK